MSGDMSGRTPAELAREVRDWLIVLLIVLRENRPEKERAIAALAELEAQAEAGLTIAEHYDEIPWFRSLAAAAPSPADQEEPLIGGIRPGPGTGHKRVEELQAQAEAGAQAETLAALLADALREIGEQAVDGHGTGQITFERANAIGAIVERALAAAAPSPADPGPGPRGHEKVVPLDVPSA